MVTRLASSVDNVGEMTGGHPWLSAFAADPAREFDRLLRGHAALMQLSRADVPDAAVQLFGGLAADHPLIGTLNDQAIAWLDQARAMALSMEIGPRRRQIGMLCDLFRLITRLKLTPAAQWVFDHRMRLTHWLAGFREGDDRDARLEFFQMLAVMQPAFDAAGKDSQVLAPLWLDLCRNAGGGLSGAYLDVGLLGLRKLPKGDQPSETAEWLAGLVQWAITQGISERDFLGKWRALKYLYPRTPAQWRTEIGRLLAEKKIRRMIDAADADLIQWWAKDPDLHAIAKPNFRMADATVCPGIDECDSIIAGLEQNLEETLNRRVPPFIAKHMRFARATGIDEFLVIATDRIGRAMVKTRTTEAAKVAVNLAVMMLRWVPDRSHGWSLWADALEILGRLDSAEAVRLEKLRRLPFVADSYTQAAEFMIARDRLVQAQKIMDRAVALNVDNAVARAVRIRLKIHLESVAAARSLFEDSRNDFPDHEPWEAYGDAFDRDHKLNVRSRLYQNFPLPRQVDESPEGDALIGLFVQNARLAGFGAEEEGGNVAVIAEILQREPENSYAKIMAARYGMAIDARADLTGFAVAFERALRDGDRAVLDHLSRSQPRLRALTLVGQAIFGDTAAADEIQRWLGTEAMHDQEPALAAFRAWLSDQWKGAVRDDNIVSFADFAAARRERLRAGVLCANEMVFEPLALAA